MLLRGGGGGTDLRKWTLDLVYFVLAIAHPCRSIPPTHECRLANCPAVKNIFLLLLFILDMFDATFYQAIKLSISFM